MTQTAVSHEPRTARTVPPLTVEDIDQIIEGIVEFIIGDSGADIQAIWQPYVEQLKAHRALIVAAPALLDALLAASADLDAALHGRRPPMNQLKLSATYSAAIAKAEGRS